jgi:hypothetical protein
MSLFKIFVDSYRLTVQTIEIETLITNEITWSNNTHINFIHNIRYLKLYIFK